MISIGNSITNPSLASITTGGGAIPSFALNFATISDDFTFTRNSFATRVNEFGLIETVTDLGSELVTNGSFDTDSDWSLTNGATISNGQLNIDYNLGNGSTTQTNVFTIGKTYKIEINVDNSSVGVVRINNGVSPTVLSNGLNTFYLEAVGTAIEIRNHVNFVGSIDNVSVKEVLEDDVPRIDYSTGEAAFLLEPQSTNLIDYSEAIAGATGNWLINSNTVVTTENVTDPNGNPTTNMIETNAVSDWNIVNIFGLFAEIRTHSWYVKLGTAQFIQLRCSVNRHYANFDLINEVIGDTGEKSENAFIEPLNNGWFRIGFTSNEVGVNIAAHSYLSIVDSLTSAFGTTADSGTVYVTNVQEEALPYATSYIPTNGSVVTRSAETCVDATPTINSEEGTLYFEGSALVETNTVTSRHITLSNGATLNNRLYFYLSKSGRFGFASFVGGVLQANITFDGVVTDNSKVACKWKENDYALWVNGAEVGTDNSASVWTANTLNTLNFSNPLDADVFYGNTKDLKIYDKALTDDELITLTTI